MAPQINAVGKYRVFFPGCCCSGAAAPCIACEQTRMLLLMALPVPLAFSVFRFTITSTFHSNLLPLCQASSIRCRCRSGFKHMPKQRWVPTTYTNIHLNRQWNAHAVSDWSSSVATKRYSSSSSTWMRRRRKIRIFFCPWKNMRNEEKWLKMRLHLENDWIFIISCASHLRANAFLSSPSAASQRRRHRVSMSFHSISFAYISHNPLPMPPLVCHQKQIDNIFFCSLPPPLQLPTAALLRLQRLVILVEWVCGCRHRFFLHPFTWLYICVLFNVIAGRFSTFHVKRIWRNDYGSMFHHLF